MKRNIFKDAKKQSFGYEPKENARITRQTARLKKNIFNWIENDDYKNLLKYTKIVEKILVNYYYDYKYKNIYEHITRDVLYDTIIKNDAYNCFYYVFKKTLELNMIWNVPERFNTFYIQRLDMEHRLSKIKKIKEKINQEK